jgi:hypothetical protein
VEIAIIFLIVATIFLVPLVRAVLSSKQGNTSTSGFDALVAKGIPARGLVLQASQQSTGVTMNFRRFEQRSMTLDVEIPGQAPYTCTGVFLIPRGLVEPTPGASLELAVDRSNANNVVVVGPGGFTGPWLNLGPPNPF